MPFDLKLSAVVTSTKGFALLSTDCTQCEKGASEGTILSRRRETNAGSVADRLATGCTTNMHMLLVHRQAYTESPQHFQNRARPIARDCSMSEQLDLLQCQFVQVPTRRVRKSTDTIFDLSSYQFADSGDGATRWGKRMEGVSALITFRNSHQNLPLREIAIEQGCSAQRKRRQSVGQGRRNLRGTERTRLSPSTPCSREHEQGRVFARRWIALHFLR